jgi:hypothetical protein
MSKPKLGIDIDEILRGKWVAFDRYYVEEFGEDGVKEPFDTYDFRNHYEFKETEIVQEFLTDEFLEDKDLQKVSPKEYVVNPETGRASVDDFAFKEERKIYSADEMFEKFLYEDYMYEIHGSAPKLYMNADVDLNTFIKLFGEHFELYFYVRTKQPAIPSTLFFLSKMRVQVKNIMFVYDDSEVWEKLDWVITTNPAVLDSKPEGKVGIKMLRQYNIESVADYTSANGTMFGLTDPNQGDEGVAPVTQFKTFLKDKLNLN